jgi:hypothetical protein
MNRQPARRRCTASLMIAVLTGAVLAGCGGGGGSDGGGLGAAGGGGTPVSNQAPLVVDAGPPQVDAINTLYATVTLCAPGSTTACQTIDHVQVDTGSTGFRVLAAALGQGVTSAQLTQVADANGNALVECVQFIDGYSWGPVKLADVKIAGETARSLAIQVIGDPAYPSSLIPGACVNIPNGEEDTVRQLGANGILGIGNYLQDCGPFCAQAGAQTGDAYNLCNTATPASCQPVAVALGQQVTNPVFLFGSDNNGVLIQLPTVAAAGATGSSGTLVFGVGTQPDNALGSATVYALDPNYGTLLTVYSGVQLGQSVVDSGSNGNYFPDASIAVCTDQSSFYCPAAPLSLTAQLEGTNGKIATVPFTVSNADALAASITAAPGLAGPAGSSAPSTFDWGLPFFYGRSVYIGFETATIGGVQGPLIAF